MKDILKYLRNTKDMFLVYGGNPEAELRFDCYCNAGFETDIDDMKSLTGYVFVLNESAAIVDVEKAVIEALEKQYADVLAPLKENLAPKKLGVKYVQKLTKRIPTPYVAPSEIGVLLILMKRMSDVLCPKI
ncbi:hypothetical protein Tco_1211733 [Tanacetum coccineum]